jgi:hypothetical protein
VLVLVLVLVRDARRSTSADDLRRGTVVARPPALIRSAEVRGSRPTMSLERGRKRVARSIVRDYRNKASAEPALVLGERGGWERNE